MAQTQTSSAIVANMKTVERFFDHFDVEVWDATQTTLVLGPYHVNGKWIQASGAWIQQEPLYVKGLTVGLTYQVRSRVQIKSGGLPSAWSPWATLLAGDADAPVGSYAPITQVSAAGVVVKINASGTEVDLNHFEFYVTAGAAPTSTTPPNLPNSTDGSVRMVLGDTEIVTLYVRVVDTSGNRQAWTSLGLYNSNGAVLLAGGIAGAGENIIGNPGFESAKGTYTAGLQAGAGQYLADGWVAYLTSSPQFKMEVENNGPSPRTGQKNGHIQLSQNVAIASGTTVYGWLAWPGDTPNPGRTKLFPVRGGDYYYFGGYARWDAGLTFPAGVTGSLYYDMVFFTSAGSLVSSTPSVSNVTAASGGQAFINGTAAVPQTAAFAQLRCSVNITTSGAIFNSGNAGSYMDARFDDVFVYKATRSSHGSYRPLSNPLMAVDAGTSSTVNIAAFTMRCGSTDLAISSGAITSLVANTAYFIYYDDPDYTGGAVVFNATTVRETAIQGEFRYFVGSVNTPPSGGGATTGNNDGGTGAQYSKTAKLVPTVYDASKGPWTNPGNAIDNDASTYTSGTSSASNLVYVASAYPSFAGWFTACALTATLQVMSVTGTVLVEYSTTNGASWTVMRSVTVPDALPVTTLVNLPLTTPTQNVQVRVTVPGSSGAQSNLSAYAASGMNDASGPIFSTKAWVNPGNAQGNQSVLSATVSDAAFNDTSYSNYLKLINFGLAVPAGATINGITAALLRNGSFSDDGNGNYQYVYDNSVKLYKAGVIVGAERANGNNWSQINTTIPYGSSIDLWGVTWSPAEINNVGFGIGISVDLENGGTKHNATAKVFSVKLTVYYTTSSGVQKSTTRIYDLSLGVTS